MELLAGWDRMLLRMPFVLAEWGQSVTRFWSEQLNSRLIIVSFFPRSVQQAQDWWRDKQSEQYPEKRQRKACDEINWKEECWWADGKWWVPTTSSPTHTRTEQGKLNFTLIYLFMVLTTHRLSLQPIFHTFTEVSGRRRELEAKATHNLIYLIKEMELGSINSPFTSTRNFSFFFRRYFS